jgi:hypothetical protein
MTLTRDEMVEILEEIARNSSNQAARIAAIKQLEVMQGDGDDSTGFDQLDELAPRRNYRTKAA